MSEKKEKKIRGVYTPAFLDHDVQRLALAVTYLIRGATLRAGFNTFDLIFSSLLEPNQTEPNNKPHKREGAWKRAITSPQNPAQKAQAHIHSLRRGRTVTTNIFFFAKNKKKNKKRGRRQKASRTLFQQPPTSTNTTVLHYHCIG